MSRSFQRDALANFAVKRHIVKWAEDRIHDARDFPDDPEYRKAAHEATTLHLKWLAAPYADRDGYRVDEWKPAP